MKPIEIACRHCAAQPGESCVWTTVVMKDQEKYRPFHPARIEDAATWTTGDAPPPSEDEFNAAVDKSGLV